MGFCLLSKGDCRRIADRFARRMIVDGGGYSDQDLAARRDNAGRAKRPAIVYQDGQLVSLIYNGRCLTTRVRKSTQRGCYLDGVGGLFSHRVLTNVSEGGVDAS